ncbi:UPF0223 family protein [Listeria fleischmannii]|jgi:uncharacterized protein YktA (UPF0223 family)|uniref:UPF0223 protein MCOL2_06347 n=2 Tax=Listeria fleischmannii TaxID=1069827 RepID=W7DPZ0_9LIST|nr:UPF0223 family protein [Listeria fleischmannii]EIA20454.1 hypothetical protein KKC_06902 [Listeria fleischmannii subsp. coloradonensis]EUJ59139.1 hypothetical protein MCOL2_06347 [Listeria fleischmannii FSL S10-1203]MBC1397302.1 UPF0223 family protein [Listeria fleischmannii]MBC1419847.1 UPF0223 family protein [Listeria fleischmannii]MBC1425671.1 UPF0223 family protein [Listeria fleischmannii]
MNYSYPIDMDWSKEEITTVIHYFEMIEKAYEKGVSTSEIKEAYRAFKVVVPSIGEEKRLGREFEDASGYSPYQVMKMLKNATTSTIKMKP